MILTKKKLPTLKTAFGASILGLMLFVAACSDDSMDAVEPEPDPEPVDTTETVVGIVIGPQTVESTPVEEGTLFVSPTGDGDCSQDNPCNLKTVKGKIVPGSVIFLEGGIYEMTAAGFRFQTNGKEDNRITYESLPGQEAIFDGSALPDGFETVVMLTGSYNVLRNLTFRNFPENGLRITGNHNLLDGISAYDNKSSGIHVWGTYDYPYGTMGSWNIIQNSVLHSNSDAGLFTGFYNDGDNADGISISSGEGNEILNNLTYNNSDDGIDVWRSTNSIIARNITYKNGKGSHGNGNGIKAGGASPGQGAVVYQNIAYHNRSNGFDNNGSPLITFHNNTSFQNGRGYVVGTDNMVYNNISFQDGSVISGTSETMSHNNWQLDMNNPKFISIDPESEDFLVLSEDSPAIDVGKDVDLSFQGDAPDLGAFEKK